MAIENKKISVIIPIYNVAEYLPQCLESVANQTYYNLEIICINDGSTDASGSVCEQYALQDERFTVLHQNNNGPGSARNRGLDICTGDYISMIDGDDFLEPGMYEVLMKQFEKEDNIEISACGYFMDYPNKSQWIKNKKEVPEKATDMREFLYYIYKRDMYRGVASYLPTKLFKADYFKGGTSQKPIRFLEDLNISEDMVVAAQCYLETNKIIYTSAPYYHYRQRDGSAMHDSNARLKKLGSCIAYEQIIELFKNAGIDPKVVNYVKRFYVYHASLLLEMAYQIEDVEKIKVLKQQIRKYLAVYAYTNISHPSRIIHVLSLLYK